MDLDGVLLQRDLAQRAAVEHAHGLPEGVLLRYAFQGETFTDAITGRVTDEAWRCDIADRLTHDFDDRARDAVQQWSSSYGYLAQDVLAVVREQRRLRPVVVLTNSTTRLPQELAALGLAGQVDGVFNSAQLGLAKPNRAVFVEVCSRLGVAVQRCAFVDDSAASVRAAGEVGLQSHHFRDAAGLRRFVDGFTGQEGMAGV